jgi:hypothetical protein
MGPFMEVKSVKNPAGVLSSAPRHLIFRSKAEAIPPGPLIAGQRHELCSIPFPLEFLPTTR